MKDLILRYLSRKWILTAAAFVLGILQTFGVMVDPSLSDKIIGVVLALGALVAYLIVNVQQKKIAK